MMANEKVEGIKILPEMEWPARWKPPVVSERRKPTGTSERSTPVLCGREKQRFPSGRLD